MNKRKNIFLILIFGLLLFPGYMLAAVDRLDKIVVVVNGEVITQSELDKKMAMFRKHAPISDVQGGVGESGAALLRKQALDSLIDTSLQLQMAKNNGIKVSESQVSDVISNFAKSNNLTIEQLKEVLPEREGVSFAEFRNQVREQLLIGRVQQQALSRQITIDDNEVRAVMNNPPQMQAAQAQYHVVDILFGATDATSPEQEETIKKVAAGLAVKLQKGASVEDVIKEGQKSLKESIRSEDLGWRKINELPTLFVKDIAKMRVNQVIGPLEAPNGIHLIKLLGVQNGEAKTVKITKEQAREIVYHRQLMKKLKPWLEELRSQAYIKISN